MPNFNGYESFLTVKKFFPNSFILFLQSSIFVAMESTRQLKVGRLIQKDISPIIQRLTKDHFPGTLVTVTKVNVTPDLSKARVNMSIFGKADKAEYISYVKSVTSEIRFELGNLIRNQLRIVPILEFFNDDTLDYIDNIDKLLKK